MALTQDYASTGWLQAFMGVNDPLLQRARLEAKKFIDCVDVLCNLTTIREKKDSVDSSLELLWNYGTNNEMGWLLKNVPACQSQWVLPSNEDFTIHCSKTPTVTSARELGCALGIYDWSTLVTMRIRSSDFTTWQRRVSRVGSGAPVGFTMATAATDFMELECEAIWKANQWVDGTWTFQLKNQPNMTASVEEPLKVVRPDVSTHVDAILLAMSWADSELRSTKNNKPCTVSTIPAWIPPGDRLVPLHECLYGGRNGLTVSQVFANVWDSVWPMIYCRRRKLGKGHCELKHVRDKLDQSLSTEPRLVSWITLMGELLVQTFTTDGLGISAKYDLSS